MNMPELYAEVVAVRPEAVAYKEYSEGARPIAHDPAAGWHCTVDDYNRGSSDFIGDNEAAALILQHWLGLLAPECHLWHNGTGQWYIQQYDDRCAVFDTFTGDTPIEALAAYLKGTPHA